MKRPEFIVIVFLFAGFMYATHQTKSGAEKAALEDLGLRLKGVVESVDDGDNFHGYGIVRLRVIYSNIKTYDPRSKLSYYFCVIKDSVAEVYDHTSSRTTLVGDTLIYDTKKKVGGRIKNGKEVDVGDISVNTQEAYYDYIWTKTMFR